MTDDAPPSVDIFEQLRASGDAAMPEILRRLQTVVEGGGSVTKHYMCGACGVANTVKVEVADSDELRKIAELYMNFRLKFAQAQKGDGASEVVTRLLRDRSELTDAELAEYIARLKEELAA